MPFSEWLNHNGIGLLVGIIGYFALRVIKKIDDNQEKITKNQEKITNRQNKLTVVLINHITQCRMLHPEAPHIFESAEELLKLDD